MGEENNIKHMGLFVSESGEKIGELTSAEIDLNSESHTKDSKSITLLRNMEFSGTFQIELPNKFGKKKIKWCRRYLCIDLLANKFPKKKNRRLRRIKRNIFKKAAHQYAYLIKKTAIKE